MEFSVKKFDLLGELNLTQGVVERKTTIPILSHLLCEAKGNTSRHHRDRPRTQHPHGVRSEGEERGRRNHSREKTARTGAPAARGRD